MGRQCVKDSMCGLKLESQKSILVWARICPRGDVVAMVKVLGKKAFVITTSAAYKINLHKNMEFEEIQDICKNQCLV